MTDPRPTSARERAAESLLAPRVQGTVRIVGAGLLGASIGHALSARGLDVALDDTSPSQLRLAIDYGAGRLDELKTWLARAEAGWSEQLAAFKRHVEKKSGGAR